MNKIDYNSVSPRVMGSNFALIRDFNVNPKIALNPAFDKEVGEFFRGYRSDLTIDDAMGYEIISTDSNVDGVPNHKLTITPNGNIVNKEYYSKDNKIVDTWAELFKHKIFLGNDESLVIDEVILGFNRYVNEFPGDSIRLTRKIYDRFGILDFIRFVKVSSREKTDDFFRYSGLLSLAEQYEGYLSISLEENLKKDEVVSSSYEITRDQSFIEKAHLKAGRKEIISTISVPLYNPKDCINNLYDMNSLYMKDAKFHSLLPEEQIMNLITEDSKSQSEITVEAMKARARKIDRPAILK